MIKLTIIIVQANDGKWNYGPERARHRLHLDYDGSYPSAEAALAAAKSDKTIPKGTTFKVLNEESI